MALNFDESILLILFAQANGASVTSSSLEKLDDDLQEAFGELLQTTMSEEGLPSDVMTRSLVLGCRPHMSGNTPAVQIRNACRYVLRGQQAVTPLFLSADVAASARVAFAAPKAKGSKKKRKAKPKPKPK